MLSQQDREKLEQAQQTLDLACQSLAELYKAVSAKTLEEKEPYEMSKAEFESLPKVYRGVTGKEGDTFLVSKDKKVAQSHGKIVIEGRVKQSALKSGPEELAFYDQHVPKDKVGSIEAIVDKKDLYPDKYNMLAKDIVRAKGDNPFKNSAVQHIVYHGSDRSITTFSKEFIGTNFGRKLQDKGFWFSLSKDQAIVYASNIDGTKKNKVANPAYLNMTNPAIWGDTKENKPLKGPFVVSAIKKGHDGVIFKNLEDGTGIVSDQYLLFNPKQTGTTLSICTAQSGL